MRRFAPWTARLFSPVPPSPWTTATRKGEPNEPPPPRTDLPTLTGDRLLRVPPPSPGGRLPPRADLSRLQEGLVQRALCRRRQARWPLRSPGDHLHSVAIRRANGPVRISLRGQACQPSARRGDSLQVPELFTKRDPEAFAVPVLRASLLPRPGSPPCVPQPENCVGIGIADDGSCPGLRVAKSANLWCGPSKGRPAHWFPVHRFFEEKEIPLLAAAPRIFLSPQIARGRPYLKTPRVREAVKSPVTLA